MSLPARHVLVSGRWTEQAELNDEFLIMRFQEFLLCLSLPDAASKAGGNGDLKVIFPPKSLEHCKILSGDDDSFVPARSLFVAYHSDLVAHSF